MKAEVRVGTRRNLSCRKDERSGDKQLWEEPTLIEDDVPLIRMKKKGLVYGGGVIVWLPNQVC